MYYYIQIIWVANVFELSGNCWTDFKVYLLAVLHPLRFLSETKIYSSDICVMKSNCENGLWWYRKLHSEGFHYSYYLPHIAAVRSTSIRLLGLVGCARAMKSSCSFWFKKMEESDHLENLHMNGRLLLKWYFEKEIGYRLVQHRAMEKTGLNVMSNLQVTEHCVAQDLFACGESWLVSFLVSLLVFI